MRASLLLAPLVLAACPEGTVCTDLAAVSVTVTVTDAATGAALVDADVSFTAEGAPEEACAELGNGDYACGYEVEGDIEIHVARAGYLAQSATVTVEADACHVIGESLTVALVADDAPGCVDDSARPSLLLSVWGSGWDPTAPYPIEDASASFRMGSGPDQACALSYDNVYVCGLEVSGTLTYTVSAPEHTSVEGTVVVGMTEDGCHVETEEVDVNLECTSC